MENGSTEPSAPVAPWRGAVRRCGTAGRLALVTLGLCVALGRDAAAQTEPAPTPSPSPEPPRIDVTGFVDVNYLYNFTQVDPALRSFDVQHNAFSLSLAGPPGSRFR